MTPWTPIVLPALVAALWLWVPGVPLALALRFRPVVAWAVAPLFSVAIIAGAAILASPTGLEWGPLPPALLTIVLWIVTWAVRIVRDRRIAARAGRPASAAAGADPVRTRWQTRSLGLLRSTNAMTVAAFVLSAALMARHVRNVLGEPGAISQTFDNIFHLNAVRWILDTGDGSSLTVGSMTSGPNPPTFYPAAWHDIVALVLRTTGGDDIPLAQNALVAVVCCGIWTSGAVLLLRTALPAPLRRVGLLPGAVLVAAVPSFPILLTGFGVLYPNLLGLSLVPATFALVLVALRQSTEESPGIVPIVITGVFAAAAISLAHPNASMTLLAGLVPLGVAAMIRAALRLRRSRRLRDGLTLGAVTVLTVLLYVVATAVWPIIRPPAEALTWYPVMETAQALGEAILVNPMIGPPSWLLAFLLAAGLYACVRRARWELPLLWGTYVYLWMAVAAWPFGDHRSDLVGVWYNDPYRLAAVLALPTAALCTIGTAHLVRGALVVAPRRWARYSGVSAGALAAVLLVVVTQRSDQMNIIVDWASQTYRTTATSQLLTVDELRVLEDVRREVPEGSVIVTNSWNGSSLAYGLEGYPTTTKHTLEYSSPDDVILNDHLDEAATDPAVCTALADLDATYVLDFGPAQVNDSRTGMSGFDSLATSPGFELVSAHGDAALYRITACG